MKLFLCSNRPEWTKQYSWLLYGEESDTMACSVCHKFPALADKASRFFTGNPAFRVHHIQSHHTSLKHQQCMAANRAQENPAEAPLDAQIRRLEAGQRDTLAHIFDLAYFVLKTELPFTAFPPLCQW